MKDRNQTALITGATSGIGLEIARLFAQDDHDLILVARSEAELRSVAEAFKEKYDIKVTTIAKDLSKMGAAEAVYQTVQANHLVVSYLVNDAGQGNYGKFWETDLQKDSDDIHLNVLAPMVLTKLFVKDMLARSEGRILQLGSMVSKNAAPFMAVYAGTKAFIYNFSQSLRSELEGTGVTVTVLRPGATDTDFFHKAHAEQMDIVQKGELADPAIPAKDGYDAMMRGDDAVVSGLQNKLMDKASNLLPDEVVTKQMKKMHQSSSTKSTH